MGFKPTPTCPAESTTNKIVTYAAVDTKRNHLKKSHIEKGSILIGEDFEVKVKAQRRVPLLFESEWAATELSKMNRHSQYLTGREPHYAEQKLTSFF